MSKISNWMKRLTGGGKVESTDSPGSEFIRVREGVAADYLNGDGIEIGPLHCPMKLPSRARVKYLDRLSLEDLRTHYPELKEVNIVSPDIIDDGETMASVLNNSQEFVVASHFLEHCENPILALSNMLRVLKSGGILFLVVPDKRRTFDVDRPTTTLEHVWLDYEQGPEQSRRTHYEEWARYVDKVTDPETARRQINHYMQIRYSIHFHAWTPRDLIELILSIEQRLNLDFAIERVQQNEGEIVIVLRR